MSCWIELKNIRKLITALVVLTFGTHLVNGTTLVALRDSKSVVLATDSKVIPFKSLGQPSTQSKISRCGKYFVAENFARCLN
jgi:hypothetical protein